MQHHVIPENAGIQSRRAMTQFASPASRGIDSALLDSRPRGNDGERNPQPLTSEEPILCETNIFAIGTKIRRHSIVVRRILWPYCPNGFSPGREAALEKTRIVQEF